MCSKTIITSINANPESIESFLDKYYVIPDYQRPYSWDKEQCIKLWEDLIEHYESQKGSKSYEPYFLGNVVVYEEKKKRYVVDGQQRLITLSLFIRAMFSLNVGYKKLEQIIYKRDEKTNDILDPRQICIEHNVLGENENMSLKETLLQESNDKNDDKSKYQKNYEIFYEKVASLFKKLITSNEIDNFIKIIIETVVLLPIKCINFESALIIFETINNRGLDLSDSDIFKSKLYRHANKEKDEFIQRWDELDKNIQNTNLQIKDFFIQYMHIVRGEKKILDSVVGLRRFFDEKDRLQDWKSVLCSLEKLVLGYQCITDDTNKALKKILNFVRVLQRFPNTYWQYPVMTFLHKFGKVNQKQQKYTLDKNYKKQFETLLEETIRYCYAKWIDTRSVTDIKDTIFKVVKQITYKENYQKTYSDNLKEITRKRKTLESKLNTKDGLGRGDKGLCLLIAILNRKQKNVLPKNYDIEHILPKQWKHYKYHSGWETKKVNANINKLGNLVILEKSLNIKSSNYYFKDKIKQYIKSDIAEVQSLSRKQDWSYSDFNKRNDEVIKKLSHFFIPNTLDKVIKF